MRRLIALVGLGALLALAVLVLYGLGRAGLEAEARRLAADERARRAVALEGARRDVEDVLSQLLARESARPYYHWRPLFVPPDLVAKQIAFVPSPLAGPPQDPLVRVYFEVRDGALCSPAIPDVPTEDTTLWTEEAQGLVSHLQPLVSALEARLGPTPQAEATASAPQAAAPRAEEPVTREVIDAFVCRSNDRPVEALDQLAQRGNQPQLESDWDQYQSRVGKQSGRYSQRAQEPVSSGVPVATYPMHLVALEPGADGWPRHLLAVRKVEVDRRAWLQGLALDVRHLRERLLPDLVGRVEPAPRGPEASATFDFVAAAPPAATRLEVLHPGCLEPGAGYVSLPAPLDGLVIADRAAATDPRELLARGRMLLDGALALALVVVVAGLALVALAARGEARLARRRADFVAAMTHELKAPLTGVRALAELLHDDLVPDEQKKREYYASMLAESERLSRLVQNVLDGSRLERGTLTVTPEVLDAAPLVTDLVTRVRPRLESEGFALELALAPALPPVIADRDALAHVLGNLLDNAAKYGRTPEGKATTIRLGARPARGGVELSVEDGGPGVAQDERARVFDRFYRGRLAPRQVGGAGLGLTIARALATAMRGELRLEARSKGAELGGARFTLWLPGASAAPLPGAAQCVPG